MIKRRKAAAPIRTKKPSRSLWFVRGSWMQIPSLKEKRNNAKHSLRPLPQFLILAGMALHCHQPRRMTATLLFLQESCRLRHRTFWALVSFWTKYDFAICNISKVLANSYYAFYNFFKVEVLSNVYLLAAIKDYLFIFSLLLTER